jgi:PTH2 family peptidyl-tRNA hydrolase
MSLDIQTTSTELTDANSGIFHPLSEELRVYLIVNVDLKMGGGKVAGQCSHATHYLLQKRDEILAACDSWSHTISKEGAKLMEQGITFNQWHNSGAICKIVLAATTAQFNDLKTELEGQCVIVRDAGRTEIASGSETVIGTFPMTKSATPTSIKGLPLLK